MKTASDCPVINHCYIFGMFNTQDINEKGENNSNIPTVEEKKTNPIRTEIKYENIMSGTLLSTKVSESLLTRLLGTKNFW